MIRDHHVVSNINYKNADDIYRILELFNHEDNPKSDKNYEPIIDKTMHKNVLDIYLPNRMKGYSYIFLI